MTVRTARSESVVSCGDEKAAVRLDSGQQGGDSRALTPDGQAQLGKMWPDENTCFSISFLTVFFFFF